MSRKNFYDTIKNSKLDIKIEYKRIYDLFHSDEYLDMSIYDTISSVFLNFPIEFRNRSLSLGDFNKTHGFYFTDFTATLTADDLIDYCEYVTSLCNQLVKNCDYVLDEREVESINLLYDIIESCMDEMGLVSNHIGDIVIYIEKNPAAIAVSENVPGEVGSSIMEYNHRKLQGDTLKKKAILKNLADNIEPEKNQLKNINTTLHNQLFQLMNKFIRHDHSQTSYIETISKNDIEAVYDDIYQMWLLAKLEIYNVDRKQRMAELLNKINS